MDHVVYVDQKAEELAKILDHSKTMIIRGATGRKLPYGKVEAGDRLFFINNNGEGLVKAQAKVKSVENSPQLTPNQSIELVKKHRDQLQLSEAQFNKWAGKRYLVLIEIEAAEAVEPFGIDKSEYGNMDDWLPVMDISTVKLVA